MSAYNPPSANLPIFDSKSFTDENTNEFLEFPTAQGIENFPNGLIGDLNGNATSASTITTNATTQITQHYINFSDSASTGTGSVQKVSGLSVFPNATTYQGKAYTGSTLLSNNMITNNLTSFQANNLILSSNSASGEIRLNLQNNTTRIATISSGGLTMATGKTISGGLAGGVAGSIVFQSAVGTTGFTLAGTSGQSLLSAGTGTPIWGTPALATSATTATNIAGGSAGKIAFNTGAGATSFTDVGVEGQALISAGTGTPIWRKNFGSPSATISTHNNIASGGQYQITSTDINKINTFSGQTGNIVVFLPTTGFTDGDSLIIINRSTVGSLSIYNGFGSQELYRLIVIPAIASTTSTVCNIGMTFIWNSSAGIWFSLGGFS